MTGISPAALVALLSGDIDNAVAASTPGGIERQEAAGQASMVANTQLPIEILNRDITREMLEAKLEITYMPSEDKVLAPVVLPLGWSIRPTEHAMHSDVLDDKGRKRLGAFYKAAFYDRNGHVNVEPFYVIDAYGGDENNYVVTIKGGGVVVHTLGEWKRPDYETCHVLEETARHWLEERYPDWRDPFAYWS